MMSSRIARALEIATNCLRSNYSKLGINAGSNHFRALWTRDAMFASLGALELGDFYAVKRTLITLFKHQRKDGLLPFRVGNYSMIPKIFGIDFPHKVRARFGDDKNNSDVKDSNSLDVIIFNEYVKKSKDIQFARENYEQIKKAIDYYGNNLIVERPYANWCDSVPKKGNVLYTNVLFWKALVSMSELSGALGLESEYGLKADRIKEQINKVFWNGAYFNDTESSSTFSSDGNVLAIVFGLTTETQKRSILKCVERFKLEDFTLKTSHPEYSQFSLIDSLGGMSDYHNLRWLWIGCAYSLIKKDMLERVAEKISQYGMVYEVYESNGRPVKRWFYKSEINFAWSSGLFVYAASKLK
jgi:glycogen debranching enzyme